MISSLSQKLRRLFGVAMTTGCAVRLLAQTCEDNDGCPYNSRKGPSLTKIFGKAGDWKIEQLSSFNTTAGSVAQEKLFPLQQDSSEAATPQLPLPQDHRSLDGDGTCVAVLLQIIEK